MKTKYFFASLCNSFFVLTTLGANCTHPDYAALATLYNATNGASWTNTMNNDDPWDVTDQANCDPCSWYGVTCENGRVIRLQLRDNNLDGPLPESITDLTELRDLRIDDNQLTGVIPVDIGTKLTKLTDLRLDNNQLSGGIPVSIWDLTGLVNLLLHNNPFSSGSIPTDIGNLINLRYLTLWGCNLTGNIPDEIGELTQLVYLDFLGNSLNGNIPNSIGNLVNLEFLSFGRNQNLTGTIPTTIGNLTNLQALSLSGNQLTGSIPPELGKLNQLERLYLHENQLSGKLPQELGKLINLEILELNDNNLTGCIPDAYIVFCMNGTDTDLSDNQLDNDDFVNSFCSDYTGNCNGNSSCENPTFISVYPDQNNCVNLVGSTFNGSSGTIDPKQPDCLTGNPPISGVSYQPQALNGLDYPAGFTAVLSNFSGTGAIGMNIYIGSCFSGPLDPSLHNVDCAYSPNGQTLTVTSDNFDGSPYYLFIWSEGDNSLNHGTFDLCVYGNSNSCPSSIKLDGIPTNDNTYTASNTIISTDTINSPLNITYKAGQSISLLPGFEVKGGATFLATIEDCNSTFQEPAEEVLESFLLTEPISEKLEDRIDLKVFPNPFSYTSTIQFDLTVATPISIQLFDLNGRQLKSIVSNANYGSGSHQLTLDSGDLQAGVYYLNMKSETEQVMRKVMIVK